MRKRSTFKSIEITTTGLGTFQVPAGVTWLIVSGSGGGGAGSSGQTTQGGSGGGGAGWTTRLLRVTPGQSVPYFVGAGGTPGSTFDSGSDGQPTSFGNVIFESGGGAIYAGFLTGGTPTNGEGNSWGGYGGIVQSFGGAVAQVVRTIFGFSSGYGGTAGTATAFPRPGAGGGGAGIASALNNGSNSTDSNTNGTPGGSAQANSSAGGGGGGAAAITPSVGGSGGSGRLHIGWFE